MAKCKNSLARHGVMNTQGHVAGHTQAMGSHGGASSIAGQTMGFNNAGGSNMAQGIKRFSYVKQKYNQIENCFNNEFQAGGIMAQHAGGAGMAGQTAYGQNSSGNFMAGQSAGYNAMGGRTMGGGKLDINF